MPEPNMLKISPIIPSSTSQKFTHYSYFILILLSVILILFFMLYCFRYWHPERHGLDAYFIVAIVQISVMYIHIRSKIVNESHPCLSLYSSLMLSLILVFNSYWLFLNYACEHPIILKLCLGVSYNSHNYALKISNL